MINQSRQMTKKRSLTSSSTAPSWRLFGPPPLLAGEDVDAYDELFRRVCEAVQPVDVIDEILVVDVVSLEWDVLRWRRLKAGLLRRLERRVLTEFLRGPELDYYLYGEHFENELQQVLQENLEEGQAEHVAQTLAHDYAQNKPDAVNKVNNILDRAGLDMDEILKRAQLRKAEELADEYARQEPGTVKLIRELLAEAGTSLESLMTERFWQEDDLDYIERIDHLTTIAEGRRNASLREIDRRRTILGEALRRSVHEIEADEFKVIEGKNAA
jgi:antitoxin component HigA of HigAB toxin-antitoxin module